MKLYNNSKKYLQFWNYEYNNGSNVKMFLGRTIIRRAIGGGRLAGGSYGRAHQGRGGAYDVPALSGTSRDLNYFAVSDIDIEGFVEENSVVFYKM